MSGVACVLFIATAAVAGCATAAPPPAPADDPGTIRARAALASLSVDNRFDEPLSILYRLTSRPASATGIGVAGPESLSAMAPVPAGEPIVLIARTATGAELVLPPRTLPLDGHWTWTISADARFTRSR